MILKMAKSAAAFLWMCMCFAPNNTGLQEWKATALGIPDEWNRVFERLSSLAWWLSTS